MSQALSRSSSPLGQRGIVTVDNRLPAGFVRRSTLPEERRRNAAIAVLISVTKVLNKERKVLRSIKGLRSRVDVREQLWRECQPPDFVAILPNIDTLYDDCKAILRDIHMPNAISNVSTPFIEQRCQELDAARRIWSGFIYEERKKLRGRVLAVLLALFVLNPVDMAGFPHPICVRVKHDKLCVMIPVEKSMTILELKQAFIEASKAAASSEEDAVETKPANIKLFKQGVDSEGNESWVALDDKATVDRAGLDQGHVIGASFASQGKFAEPVIANPEDENAEPPML